MMLTMPIHDIHHGVHDVHDPSHADPFEHSIDSQVISQWLIACWRRLAIWGPGAGLLTLWPVSAVGRTILLS